MSHAILLSSSLFLFFGKMVACGFLGCLIMGFIRITIELRMNPKGWKSAKDFCHSNPRDFLDINNKQQNKTLTPSRIPVENSNKKL